MSDRDPGVIAAISAAGGINALARALGINQAAVSRWRKIPSGRIIAIENKVGVRREVLRPDLYTEAA
jgi:DNA-binding transcriptional regulator YdaS (Cro superfamily)